MLISSKNFFLCSILLLIFVTAALGSSFANAATITDGRGDLSRLNLSKDPVSLSGTWELYWNQLLTPQDINAGQGIMTGYFSVPKRWSGTLGGQEITTFGVATYRAIIKTSISDAEMLVLSLDNIRMASAVYANGIKIANCGTVAKDQSVYSPANLPYDATLYSKDGHIELIIQVANFTDATGGITAAPTLGGATAIWQADATIQLYNFFMVLFFVIIGFFLLCVFLLVPREKGLLYFSLACFGLSGVMLVNGQRSLIYLLNNYSWEQLFRLNMISLMVALLAINHFIREINSELLRRRFVVPIDTCFIGVAIYCSFGNISTFYSILLPLFIFINVWYIFIIFRIGMLLWQESVRQQKISFCIVFAALLCLYVSWFNSLMELLGWWVNIPYQEHFLALFTVLVAIYFAHRFAHEYNSSDKFKKKSIVSETAFLHSQIQPHFLFNSLNTVISLCYIDGKRAGEVLTKLSIFLRNRFNIDDSEVYTTIEDELNLVKSYLSIEQARFGDRLQVRYQFDSTLLQEDILPFSIQPLVENAVIHGVLKKPEGGEITISVLRIDSNILVIVRDNGLGMSPSVVASLQDEKHKGSVGVTNVNRRLKIHYKTSLAFHSTPEGTRVQFQFPLKSRRNK